MAKDYRFFKDSKGNQLSVGIKPRHWPKVKGVVSTLGSDKSNTAKPRNNNRKGALSRRERNLNKRRNAMTATMAQPKNATSFRMPGSLRGW